MSTAILDIVVLVHDQPKWADLCIRAVEHHTRNPYRLIIVDMASREKETKDLLNAAESRGHTIVRLAENRSFSNGVNAGVGVGSAKYICVLNDDALVTEGWDTAMIQDASEKTVGLVGARSNFALGAQGDPGWAGSSPPPFLVFVCVMLRRDVWSAVGPLDEQTFDGFSSEDLDYSWRILKASFRLKVSSAFVYHAGSRTLMATKGDAEARRRNDEKYNARLVDKWGKEWIDDHCKLKEKILVVSYHAEEMARVKFFAHLLTLKADPRRTFSYIQHSRSPIHLARQIHCDFAVQEGFDVLVQLDDDSTFPHDLLPRLLDHQKEVVCALAFQRKPPFNPAVYALAEDGIMGVHMMGIEHTGLRKVDISGFHCSAIRTSVIKKLRAYREKDEKGVETHPQGIRQYFGGFENKVGEDFAFCLNLRKIGVPVYCDTDLISGHIGDAIVVDDVFRRTWASQQPR